jgi:hypothetical protein
MATSKTEGKLHPNPKIARALADPNAEKYTSAAELARAHGINDKATQRTLRQVMRDNGDGVGRGNRYNGISTAKVAKAAKSVASKRAKATKAAPKPKAKKEAAASE